MFLSILPVGDDGGGRGHHNDAELQRAEQNLQLPGVHHGPLCGVHAPAELSTGAPAEVRHAHRDRCTKNLIFQFLYKNIDWNVLYNEN